VDRDGRITREALALWIALYGEPPIVEANGSQLIDAMVKCMPVAPYRPPGETPDED